MGLGLIFAIARSPPRPQPGKLVPGSCLKICVDNALYRRDRPRERSARSRSIFVLAFRHHPINSMVTIENHPEQPSLIFPSHTGKVEKTPPRPPTNGRQVYRKTAIAPPLIPPRSNHKNSFKLARTIQKLFSFFGNFRKNSHVYVAIEMIRLR
jgi:hypothetical protein